MSRYEMQIRVIGQSCNQSIREIEREGGEVLSAVVPGSKLHQKIHNPVTEGAERQSR